jgi:hypothetical protein
MIQADPDALGMLDITLTPESRLHTPKTLSPMTGRVSLGYPVVRKLTAREAAGDVEGWLEFLTHESLTSDYYLLSLVCSFRPAQNGDKFIEATVGIELKSTGEPADRQPIAWSISPSRRTVAGGRTSHIALNAKLAFLQTTVDLTPGPEPEQLVVVGAGERDSDPEWSFRASNGSEIVGDETLAVIVKAAKDVPVRAHVRISATLKHHRFGRSPYRADMPPLFHAIDLRP